MNFFATAYNPIDQAMFLQKVTPSEKRVSLVANVTSRIKNHLLFLEMAASFCAKYPEDVKFCIYGKLPNNEHDTYYQSLLQRIHELKLKDRIFLMGIVPNSDLYSSSSVVVHTYPFESFGRIYIEAMAAGVPIVAVKGGGASELIQEEVTGLLVGSSEIEGMSDKVHEALFNEELRSKLISNGREYAAGFRAEKLLPELYTFYQTILKIND